MSSVRAHRFDMISVYLVLLQTQPSNRGVGTYLDTLRLEDSWTEHSGPDDSCAVNAQPLSLQIQRLQLQCDINVEQWDISSV